MRLAESASFKCKPLLQEHGSLCHQLTQKLLHRSTETLITSHECSSAPYHMTILHTKCSVSTARMRVMPKQLGVLWQEVRMHVLLGVPCQIRRQRRARLLWG